MKTSRYIIASGFLILLSILIGIGLYNQMPDLVASHWDIDGKVNGYMSKFWGVFIMPIISSILLVILLLVPKLDPLNKNIAEFKNYYYKFILVLVAFLFYLYLITLAWNLGYEFNMNRYIAPAFGILFYFLGVLLENSKQNWFIGIRTPCTLSNEKVWDKTHKLGGKVFKFGALLISLGIFLPNLFFAFMLVATLVFIIFSFGYSYYLYTKEKK
ncbi:SdpI family protein [Candidatus Dojkabacteria bacterium]|nr:SdpI family protein [Candidatus Dojkabacteria bacterium]